MADSPPVVRGTLPGQMLALRQALRDHAERLRQRAARSQLPVARHLLLRAAQRYEASAAEAVRAEQTERQAADYERDPGRGGDAGP